MTFGTTSPGTRWGYMKLHGIRIQINPLPLSVNQPIQFGRQFLKSRCNQFHLLLTAFTCQAFVIRYQRRFVDHEMCAPPFSDIMLKYQT
ncbi:hypothetical protein BGV54_06720 [Burkholderia ubonensis]|nr:hypothetical protein BGV54_06720 [Burkholderia ubonensis]